MSSTAPTTQAPTTWTCGCCGYHADPIDQYRLVELRTTHQARCGVTYGRRHLDLLGSVK